MRAAAPTREELLLGSLGQGEGTLPLGPEVVWLDVTTTGGGLWTGPPQNGGPLGLDPLLSLARQLQAGATRRVVLGWAADPTHHPNLPATLDLLLAHGVDLELQVPLRSLEAALACADDRVLRVIAVAEGAELEQLPRLERAAGEGPTCALTAVLDSDTGPKLDQVLSGAVAAGFDEAAPTLRGGDAGAAGRALAAAARQLVLLGERWRPQALEGAELAQLTGFRSAIYLPLERRAGFRWREGNFCCPDGLRATTWYVNRQRRGQLHIEVHRDRCERCCVTHKCEVNQVFNRITLHGLWVRDVALLAHRAAGAPGGLEDGAWRLLPTAAAWLDARGDLRTSCRRGPEGGAQLTPPLARWRGADCWQDWWNASALRALRAGDDEPAGAERPLDSPTPCGPVEALARRLDHLRTDDAPAAARSAAAVELVRMRAEERRQAQALARRDGSAGLSFELGRCLETVRRHGFVLDAVFKREQQYKRQARRLRGSGHHAAPATQPPLDLILIMCPLYGPNAPPLNLGVLTEYLRHHGVPLVTRDFNIECYQDAINGELEQLWPLGQAPLLSQEEEFARLWEGYKRQREALVDWVLASEALVVGFTMNVRNRRFVEALAAQIKAGDPNRLVVAGGPEVTFSLSRGDLNAPGVDLYVVGEAEETLLELVRRRRSGASLEGVAGVVAGPPLSGADDPAARLGAYRARPLVRDLDSLPFPTYKSFSLECYARLEMPFLFSRGCRGRCSYCVDHTLFRCRSGEHGAAEIEHHIREYEARSYNFNDLLCNGDPDKLADLCQLLLQRGLRIWWGSYANVHRNLTPQLLDLMHRAGCQELLFGVESGSNAMLRLMRKPYNVSQVERALRDATAAGINTGINIIVGFPGETERDFVQTREFLERNAAVIHRVVNLSVTSVPPGSPLSLQPEAFDLKYDERDGSWYAESGNTLARRLRRLQRMQDLLGELRMLPEIVNR